MFSNPQIHNSVLLFLSLAISFGGVIVFFRLFGKAGLFAWTCITTITANIEVLILVRAFGMEQTLGNTLFAATFLATDILSECYGKKAAQKAVWLGAATNLAFVCITQSWFLYVPSDSDWAMPAISTIFSNTPRLMAASLIGYVVSETFDVWAYHALWRLTERRSGNARAFLWVRNNGSTLTSQLINVVLFNVIAFAGVYGAPLLMSIIVSGYVIYVATSLLDTPFMYFARWMHGTIVPSVER